MSRLSRDSEPHSAFRPPAGPWRGTADSGGADNCYSDYAQTNAQDLMTLLADIDADVEAPHQPAPDAPAS